MSQLPPDIAALLGGGGQGPDAGAAPAPPDQGQGPDSSDSSGGSLDDLQAAIDSAKRYVDQEDDQIHIQTALQCIAKLQSILADEQKQQDELLQGKASPRSLRRASGSSGY
jgi:hypothetical protein